MQPESEEDTCFIYQVINMKYEMTVKKWQHPGQTAACYLLSAAPAAPKLPRVLMYVLCGGMWW